MSNYLGQAGAYAMHKKYKAGSLTYAQIQADRANLQKARAARNKPGTTRHTKSEKVNRDFKHSSMKSRGSAGRDRAYNMRDLNALKGIVIGEKKLHYEKKAHLRNMKVTGLHHKFMGDIAPTRFMGRSSWGHAHRTKFLKVLKPRKRRLAHQSRWRATKHTITPR